MPFLFTFSSMLRGLSSLTSRQIQYGTIQERKKNRMDLLFNRLTCSFYHWVLYTGHSRKYVWRAAEEYPAIDTRFDLVCFLIILKTEKINRSLIQKNAG
jgi:hypothetical protein